MLADRHYMQDSGYRPPMLLSLKLIILLTVIFALQCINDVYVKSLGEVYLGLTPAWFYSGYLWQLISFQFLHVNLWHLLGNVIVLWFIGRHVESWIGRKKFLWVYLIAGTFGGLLQGALMVALPNHFAGIVFGASAGAYGIFAVFCVLASSHEIRMWFCLPIRADILLWIFLGISAFFTLVPTPREGGIAHTAHLGGMLFGIWFVRKGWHRDYIPLPWVEWWSNFRQKTKRSGRPFIQKVQAPAATSKKTAGANREEDSDFISSQVDPILDKISQKGLHSLTDKEREILEKARKNMGR